MARNYQVHPNDTLSGIAQRFYGDPTLFGLIATANNLANPNLIVPGQILRIPQLPAHWDVLQGFAEFDTGPLQVVLTRIGVDVDVRVPAGMRYVVENVSGFVFSVEGIWVEAVRFGEGVSSDPPWWFFPWTARPPAPEPGARAQFAFNFVTKMYLDGPIDFVSFSIDVNIDANPTNSSAHGWVALAGYLEALPPV
jgi:LysM repeat protein